MAHHEKPVIDMSRPYEQNKIKLGGIVWFAIGIAVLSILSFGLMWVFMNVLEEGKVAEDKAAHQPMALDTKDKLPPEPRLQVGPGFGVDGPNGRVNMELGIPQAEYRELKRQWDDALKNGIKDPKTGTVVRMPIEEAKKKLLEEGLKSAPADQGQKALEDASSIVSYSSAGRRSSEKRR